MVVRVDAPPVAPAPPPRAASPAASSSGGRFASLNAADLTIGEEIGKGRFKQVCRGALWNRREGLDDEVVVLRYAKAFGEQRELWILAHICGSSYRMDAPFVPQVYGTCEEGRETLVLQERAEWGSLKAALTNPQVAPHFGVAHKIYASAQVSRAMVFLRSVRVVHADLSCRNCLLFCFGEDAASIRVKVTDFGLAFILRDEEDSECRKQPQATRWCAPEAVAWNKLSYLSDVWSLGATLWELFSGGELPWAKWQKRANVAARLRALAEEEQGDVTDDFPQPEGCPASAHSLVLSCLRVAEVSRPDFLVLAESFLALVAPPEDADEVEVVSSAVVSHSTSGSTAPTWGTLTPSTSAGMCTPSPATPSGDLWSKRAVSAGTRGGGTDDVDVFASRCESLREFLCSANALQLFGNDVAIKAFKTFLQTPEARVFHGGECVPEVEAPEAAAAAIAPLRDLLVPLAANGLPAEASAPPLPGAWTLHILVGANVLRRQDFANSSAAWAAFEAAAASRPNAPCILRDPCGTDAASQAWLVIDRCVAAVRSRRLTAPRAAIL